MIRTWGKVETTTPTLAPAKGCLRVTDAVAVRGVTVGVGVDVAEAVAADVAAEGGAV